MASYRDMPGAAFKGSSAIEVTAVLANCGTNTARAAAALKLYIVSKQRRGKPESDIIAKLEPMEKTYLLDASIHEAFHAARAETGLPRSGVLPPSRRVREIERQARERERELEALREENVAGPSRSTTTFDSIHVPAMTADNSIAGSPAMPPTPATFSTRAQPPKRTSQISIGRPTQPIPGPSNPLPPSRSSSQETTHPSHAPAPPPSQVPLHHVQSSPSGPVANKYGVVGYPLARTGRSNPGRTREGWGDAVGDASTERGRNGDGDGQQPTAVGESTPLVPDEEPDWRQVLDAHIAGLPSSPSSSDPPILPHLPQRSRSRRLSHRTSSQMEAQTSPSNSRPSTSDSSSTSSHPYFPAPAPAPSLQRIPPSRTSTSSTLAPFPNTRPSLESLHLPAPVLDPNDPTIASSDRYFASSPIPPRAAPHQAAVAVAVPTSGNLSMLRIPSFRPQETSQNHPHTPASSSSSSSSAHPVSSATSYASNPTPISTRSFGPRAMPQRSSGGPYHSTSTSSPNTAAGTSPLRPLSSPEAQFYGYGPARERSDPTHSPHPSLAPMTYARPAGMGHARSGSGSSASTGSSGGLSSNNRESFEFSPSTPPTPLTRPASTAYPSLSSTSHARSPSATSMASNSAFVGSATPQNITIEEEDPPDVLPPPIYTEVDPRLLEAIDD